MAINELGIFPNVQNAVMGASNRIDSSDGTVTQYVRFKTQSANWKNADISIVADAITKSGSEGLNGYVNIGTASRSSIARSTFSMSAGSSDATGYVWSLEFGDVTGLSTLLGTLSYSGRSYDALRLKITVTVHYPDGTPTGTTTGSKTCYIGFIPTFGVVSPSGIYVDKNGLTIEYTASGWGRANDRWAVMDITDGSETVIKDSEVYGKVGSAGKLTIPKGKLRYIPQSGDTLTGSIRMTGSWMGTGTNLGYLDLSTVTVVNKYSPVKVPQLNVTVVSDGVSVSVGEGGSGSSLDSALVSLVGSYYDMDSFEIPIGGSHVFTGIPCNVPLEFQAVGYSSAAGELAASAVVKKSVDTHNKPIVYPSNALTIIHADGQIELYYNITVSTSNKPEVNVVKFAGRKRQTVGFGVGGYQTWKIDCTIITDATDLETNAETEIRELPEKGVCILRFPDGRRAQVYVTNVEVGRPEYGGVMRPVSIDCEEVA